MGTMLAMIGYSQYLAMTAPSEAYFLIQSRAFEMLIGAFLAILIYENNRLGRVCQPCLYKIIGVAGCTLVAASLIVLNKERLFPGVNAAVVCLGAAMIIFSGENQTTPVARLLSSHVLVWLGKLSYSMYLWHWPIQAFYRYYQPDFGWKGFVICSSLTLVLSYISMKCVENPARYLRVNKRTVFLGYFLIPVLAIVFVAKNIEKKEGYPERFGEEARSIYYDSVSNIESENDFRTQLDQNQPFRPMLLGSQTVTKPKAFLWGDSHAQHFQPFVDELGKKYHFGALYGGQGGCPPIAEGGRARYGELEEHCYKSNEQLLDEILSSDAEVVFLGGRWSTYAETTLAENEDGRNIYLGDIKDRSESIENNRRVFSEGMDKTIALLVANGKTPVVFEQAPSFPFKPSNCLVKKANFSWAAREKCDIEAGVFYERYQYARSLLHKLKDKYPSMVIIDIPSLSCNDGICSSELNGRALYSDNNHLSAAGARAFYEAYSKTKESEVLKKLFTG
nr:acyltransferase family protein [Grimontia marina]